MAKAPLILMLEDSLFNLGSSLLDGGFRTCMLENFPQHTVDRYYMRFLDFHMFVTILKKKKYVEAESFNSELFYKLGRHKNKLLFEIIIDFSANIFRVVKILYSEKPDRMGLKIKKAILKTFTEAGFYIKFEDGYSKIAEKSFFYFS